MKKEYIEKAKSRQKQFIEVLTSKPSFLDAIKALRMKWSIPTNGFKTQNELDAWYENLNIATVQYFSKEWASKRKELSELRNKASLTEYKKIQDLFNKNAPRNAFLFDIKKLVSNQKLSPRWDDGIKRYLLLNDPNNMGVFIGVVVKANINMELNTETISLEIESETTLEDIKAIWPTVKNMQSKLLYNKQRKYQPLRQFNRNKKAYELHKKGKKYREIAEELSTSRKTVGEEDVAKMIERYKKKVDIN